MSRIKSKDTKPEMVVRRMLRSMGYGYTLHGKGLPGKPDIVFKGRRKVVLVNGCFWHQHDCRPSRQPKTNAEFWNAKLRRNVERDLENKVKMKDMGWKTKVIWECELKNPRTVELKLSRFLEG